MDEILIKWEEERVIVIRNGTLVHDLHWKAALDLCRAIYAQACKAEEWANKDRLVLDQSILLRAGSPLPLTDNLAIQEEAMRQSRWNRMLRRYMPVAPSIPEQIGHIKVRKETS